MDTLLTILGGLVLICSLAYLNSQDVPRREDRLFESAEQMLPLESETDTNLELAAMAEGASRPAES